MSTTVRYLAIALGCGLGFGLACGGSTRGDASEGSAASGAAGVGDTSGGGTRAGEAGADAGGTEGGSDSGGTGARETAGSGSTATGGNPIGGGGSSDAGAGTSAGTAGASGGASSDGGVGAAASGGDGAAGDDFIWDGHDLTGVEIDESSSGTPVPADDPGNAYGRTTSGGDDPGALLDCPHGGFGTAVMCLQFGACASPCSASEECPSVESGNTSPECGGPLGEDLCVLPCGDGLICPDGMACVLVETQYLCAWPSLILVPGCPGYCVEQDGPCDSWTAGECCEGLVCAPWSQCEPGSCLRPSWPCSDDTAPCCVGAECVEGYCT
jgi:hypothetical protein